MHTKRKTLENGRKKQQRQVPTQNTTKENKNKIDTHTHKTQLARGDGYCFANMGNQSVRVQDPRRTNSWAVAVDRYLEQWIWRQAAARHRGSTYSSPRAARWVIVDARSLAFLFGEKHRAGKAD